MFKRKKRKKDRGNGPETFFSVKSMLIAFSGRNAVFVVLSLSLSSNRSALILIVNVWGVFFFFETEGSQITFGYTGTFSYILIYVYELENSTLITETRLRIEITRV